MGKMFIGPRGQSKKQHVLPGQAPLEQQFQEATSEVMKRHAELFERLTELENQEKPTQVNVEKIVEKVETVREVSVITKDKRARQLTKALKSRLEAMRQKHNVVSDLQDKQSIDIEDLLQHINRLEAKISSLEQRETALEAAIPEENQEVKEVKVPGLVYLGVTASILLSLLGLILK